MDVRVNLDRHMRGSKRVDMTGVAWERVGDDPLSEAEIRCLTYMMDIESHTIVFLRDLLATRAAEEPELTAFLACWAYEELWHGEAISRLLGQSGVLLGPDRRPTGWDDPYPSRVERNRWVRRTSRLRGRLTRLGLRAASTLTEDFAAAHMTWGAINELTTLSAYEYLADSTANPVLADVLRRIVRDERRHYSFYRIEAERRLASGHTARRVTRFALHHLWAIVGTGVRPQSETDFVLLHMFSDEGGPARARRMDATVDSLPGLDGLRLFETAVAKARARAPGSRCPGQVSWRARSRMRSPSRCSGGIVLHRKARS